MADYGGFGAIVKQAQAIDADERMKPEGGCPRCGTPLQRNSVGTGNCPLGHYRTSR